MSLEKRTDVGNISEVIADNFGANATYVEGLLARWQSDPSLVDESWRAYFEELIGPNGDRATETPMAAVPKETPKTDGNAAAAAPAKEKPKRPAATTPASLAGEALPIRGPALKIVENMQASLAVPTATSQRRIPVRLLDENRRIINRHLEEAGRRKASYTHLIAYALLDRKSVV